MRKILCVLPGTDGISDYDSPYRLEYEKELAEEGWTPPKQEEDNNDERPF